MYLIFVIFETELLNRQTLRKIYISIKNVFKPDQYFLFSVIEKKLLFLLDKHVFDSVAVMPNHICFAHLSNHLAFNILC